MVSPAVIVEGWEVRFNLFIYFYREEFTNDLSAGALTVKESHKGTLETRAPRMRAHLYDSWYLGLG